MNKLLLKALAEFVVMGSLCALVVFTLFFMGV